MYIESKSNSLAVIRLNHGNVNAIDIEFCDALIAKLNQLVNDEQTDGVVISGNGRVFSAGIDLKRWLREGTDYVEPLMIRLELLFETIFCFPKPVVSLINGHAIAGGCMLATACDYRVIGTQAKIGILESRLGVPLPMTAIEIVRHVATAKAFKNIVTLGATFIGGQAVTVGLADTAGDSESIEAAAFQAARQLIAIPKPAFQLTRKQVRDPVMRIVNENKNRFFEQYIQIWQSEETRSAVQTYVEQRLN